MRIEPLHYPLKKVAGRKTNHEIRQKKYSRKTRHGVADRSPTPKPFMDHSAITSKATGGLPREKGTPDDQDDGEPRTPGADQNQYVVHQPIKSLGRKTSFSSVY